MYTSSIFKRINYILLSLFFFVIAIDPSGTILGIKEILFVFLFTSGLCNNMLTNKVQKDLILIIGFALILPTYGILISLLRGNFADQEYAFGHLKSFLFILITFVLIQINIHKIFKIMFWGGTTLAILTCLIFIIYLLNEELFSLVYSQTYDMGMVIISRREYYGIPLQGVYMKAGPLIIFSTIYSMYFYKENILKYFFIAINLFALFVAGSRTPMLIAALLLIIFFFDKKVFGKKSSYIFLIIMFCSLSMLILILASEKQEHSVIDKSLNLYSYIDNIFHGSNSIFGAGLGSVFWANGKAKYISNSELTYLDLLRDYGIILGTLLIFVVYYPIIICLKSNIIRDIKYNRFIIGYLLYMILAGTNPLLISSTRMFVWAVGLSIVNYIKKKEKYDKRLYCNLQR